MSMNSGKPKVHIAKIIAINLSFVLWLTPKEPDLWYLVIMIPAIMAETMALVIVTSWAIRNFQSIRHRGREEDEKTGGLYHYFTERPKPFYVQDRGFPF